MDSEQIQIELKRFQSGIDLVTAALQGLSPESVRARPVPGKWSMLECVCHLADFEPILAYRIKSVIAFHEPELVGIDETRYGQALHYEKREIEEELAVFVSTRRQLHRILSHCQPSLLARRGRHTELGWISAWTYLKAMSGHLEHHMQPINEKRVALGLSAVVAPASRDYPARGEAQ